MLMAARLRQAWLSITHCNRTLISSALQHSALTPGSAPALATLHHTATDRRPPQTTLTPNMNPRNLSPPAGVRGMTELDLKAFERKISVPHIIVSSCRVGGVLKRLKKYLLMLQKIKPVMIPEDDPQKRVIRLNPTMVSHDVAERLAEEAEGECVERELVITYENWRAEDILKAVLPIDQEGSQSFSLVGHILHLNLRENVLPYKHLIGQVYLDKVPGITMVVNKVNTIDSTYRNFAMEVLAGSGDTQVTVRENGCSYTMDFAKVYWNPRLSTEHSRIVEKLRHGDVLYDTMAGVGPFTIPAGRKKCHVLANDLNPDSFDALVKNCTKNKVDGRVRCFNLDGNEFITTALKTDLLERWADRDFIGNIHITMNLPALAVTFLPSFRGLVRDVDVPDGARMPTVHVYMFTKETTEAAAVGLVAENLGYDPKTETVCEESESDADPKLPRSYERFKSFVAEVVHVRQVAPNKAMMRVSFVMPREVLTEAPEEPPCKKLKLS